MLKRIRIRGYKTLRDVEVELEPLSVLIGPNAAGKSNFLDALQLLSKLASTRTLKEAFDPPYRGKPLESFSFGTTGLRGLLDMESVRFSMEADVEISDAIAERVEKRVRDMRDRGEGEEPLRHGVTERRLRYRIEVEMNPRTGFLRVSDEYLAALRPNGEVSKKRAPFIEKVDRGIRLRLEGQGHPKQFELRLDHSIMSLPHYPPHYPHIVAAREALAGWAFFYFEPRERMRASNPVREVRHIGMMGEELPAYLNTLKALEPKQFDAIQRSLRLMLPQIDGIEVDVNDLGEVELRLIEYGNSIPSRIVSEGTLRILGMLALSGSTTPSSLIGFEEPENGIHPRRIELIAEALRARGRQGITQFIVTTHSPTLSNRVDPAGLLVVRRTDQGTTMEPMSLWGPLAQKGEVVDALEDDGSEAATVSEMIMRGDFDE